MFTPLVLFLGLTVATAVIAYWSDNLGKKLGKKRVSPFGLRPRTTATVLTITSSWAIMLFTLAVLLLAVAPLRNALFRYDAERAQYRRDISFAEKRLASTQQRAEKRLAATQGQLTNTQSSLSNYKSQLQAANGELKEANNSIKKAQAQVKSAAAKATQAQSRTREAQRRENAARRGELQAERLKSSAEIALSASRSSPSLVQEKFGETQSRLSQARKRLTDTNSRLKNINARLQLTSKSLFRATRQAFKAGGKLLVLERNVLALERQRSELVEQYDELQGQRDELQKQVSTLATAAREYSDAAAQLSVAALQLAGGDVRVPVGRVFASRVIRAGQSPDTIETELREIFEQGEGGFRFGDDTKDLYANGTRLELLPFVEDSGEVVEGEQIFARLAREIASQGEATSIRLAAFRNFTAQEKVVVAQFVAIPVAVALRSGEIIARSVIDGSQGDAVIFRELLNLTEEGREVAVRRKVAPPQSPDNPTFYALGTTNISLFQALRRIEATKRPVRVNLVAAGELTTVEPLKVRFEIVETTTNS